jgi:hypothetical protein
VAVGYGGIIFTSRNGMNWMWQALGNNDFMGVTYGNGLFVVVGQNGTILTSSDGAEWTEQTSPTRDLLYGVTYGNGTFVAVSFYGAILTSP